MARHSQYPQIKVDEALLAYYTLGTYEKASEATDVPKNTLHHWVTKTHTDRYDELVAEHGPKLERQVIGKLGKAVDKAVDRVDQALDAMSSLITDGNYKDANLASGAAKNAALILGISNDHKLKLEGRPFLISETRDAEDILRSLNERIPGLVIDSTAQELPTPALNPGTRDPALRSQSDTNAREKQPA